MTGNEYNELCVEIMTYEKRIKALKNKRLEYIKQEMDNKITNFIVENNIATYKNQSWFSCNSNIYEIHAYYEWDKRFIEFDILYFGNGEFKNFCMFYYDPENGSRIPIKDIPGEGREDHETFMEQVAFCPKLYKVDEANNKYE